MTNNCSSITYYVISTVKCSGCPETINATDNSATCRGVISVQDCSVSIQTVTECSISDSATFHIASMIIKNYDLNKCLSSYMYMYIL